MEHPWEDGGDVQRSVKSVHADGDVTGGGIVARRGFFAAGRGGFGHGTGAEDDEGAVVGLGRGGEGYQVLGELGLLHNGGRAHGGGGCGGVDGAAKNGDGGC